jgi:hypothetical protein
MPEKKATIKGRRVRREALVRLGGYRDHKGEIRVRCASPDCRWHNDDGTRGCNDERALHIHHKDGSGNEDRTKHPGSSFYYFVLREPEHFLVVCANCHEIMTYQKGQRRGQNQHKRLALVRASKQVPGQPPRRIRAK